MTQLTDREFDHLMRLAAHERQREAVASLLAGNDVGCFTTQQYRDRYCRMNAGVEYIFAGMPELARRHLAQHRGLVEVKADVWAAISGD